MKLLRLPITPWGKYGLLLRSTIYLAYLAYLAYA